MKKRFFIAAIIPAMLLTADMAHSKTVLFRNWALIDSSSIFFGLFSDSSGKSKLRFCLGPIGSEPGYCQETVCKRPEKHDPEIAMRALIKIRDEIENEGIFNPWETVKLFGMDCSS